MSGVQSNVLEEIVAATRRRVDQRRERLPREALGARTARLGDRRSLTQALARPGLAIIAEHKRRSPSAGVLREGATVAEIAGAYERGGARALSILTEEDHFDGCLEDLRQARASSSLPVLRKDFIVDEYQLHEALAAGADAVLLIVAALTARALGDLRDVARRLGLEVLVEIHDRAELDRALAVSPDVLGINNRDLTDFSVDVGRTFALMEAMPAGQVVISESGLGSREQLEALDRAGVAGALIGERLMRAPDPEAACRSLVADPESAQEQPVARI